MAGYGRALRVVVNGLVLLGLLLSGLPVSQVAATSVPGSGVTAEDSASSWGPRPADPSLNPSSPDYLSPAASGIEPDLADWRLDHFLASLDRPIGWGSVTRKATRSASTSRNEGASQARPFTPRALPVTFTFNEDASLLDPTWSHESAEVLRDVAATEGSDLNDPSSARPLSLSPASPTSEPKLGSASADWRPGGPDQTASYATIPMRSSTIFFDTFNPINPGWEFGTVDPGEKELSDFVNVNTDEDHDNDSRSLFITEQVGLTKSTSWATITLTVPSDLSDLYLSFWNREAPGYTIGHCSAEVDGNTCSCDVDSATWDQKTYSIPTSAAADGSVVIKFEVPSQMLVHGVLFDEVKLYTSDTLQEPLPLDQTLSKGECPLTACSIEAQNFVADPINTYSGNYN
jgi:hypothetical protein